jgi:hexosaminidase
MIPMFRLIIFLFVLPFVSPAFAQRDNSVFHAENLSIHWQVLQNDYQNKPWALNALIITNNGSGDLPATGWKMYFNSAGLFIPETVGGNARIDFVNGDLFSLTPINFSILKPGASARIEYITVDPIVNITDGPEGFYLVWDQNPGKGFPTGKVVIDPFKPSYKGLVTPQIIYDQNKVISNLPADKLIKIFPTPLYYQESNGGFTLTGSTGIVADERFLKEKEGLQNTLQTLLGIKNKGIVSGNTINLIYKEGIAAEGYELEVKTNSIELRASTPAGIFYAVQSFKMLLPPASWSGKQESIQVPVISANDQPRFGYRAFMLDVGRNFQSKNEVLRILDLMALYKLNVFHFHLTEDEGWRLEIPSIPELTSLGSQRGHTIDSKHFLPASHGSGPDTSKISGSGFYTKSDFIEILRYASDRHIRVLPEIETPGHARAAIKSMNARYERLMKEGKKRDAEHFLLYDPKDSSKYSSNQYWNDNIIDPSLGSTYNFIETVINDIVLMYKEAGAPLTTIHFGGDEVPAHVWENSPAYLNLKSIDPAIKNTGDLWYYFYGRVNNMLKARGLYLAGWEEMALRKTTLDGNPIYLPNPDFESEHLQVEVWNNTLGGGNEDLAYKLANGGYKVILTPVTNFYFDMAHYKSFEEPGYYWGAFTDIDKPFSFIPYDYYKNSKVDKDGLPLNMNIFVGKQRLTDYGKSNIAGLQSAVWGENIKTPERLEYMLLPNLLGFAERAWSKNPDWAIATDTSQSSKLYSDAWILFMNTVGKRQLPMLDYYMGGYNYRIPKPGLIVENGFYKANIQFPDMLIRYTTDGTEPTIKSRIYKDPIPVSAKGIKLRSFDVKGRGSAVTESFE